ncbi:hypothetical protein ORJ04_12195 [Rheinheimera baltica]|uniref:Uncharacterized protein n=1 Tax=Rheinheimera baltica TaxID=67576 RepID=A0ABT9I020_9GAMM|nr:hypothetical protein [Rheinheimera baltica]MDP5136709.1 hypothetical protein [Rheinheimera baltica]
MVIIRKNPTRKVNDNKKDRTPKLDTTTVIAYANLCTKEKLPNRKFFTILASMLKEDKSYQLNEEEEKKINTALRKLHKDQLEKLNIIRSKLNHENSRFRASIDKRIYKVFIEKFACEVLEAEHKKLFNEFIEAALIKMSKQEFENYRRDYLSGGENLSD